MEKLKRIYSFLSSYSLELKKNGQSLNPMLTYVLLFLGAYQAMKILGLTYWRVLYPSLRKAFHKILRTKNTSIFSGQQRQNQWVLIYGATTHIGTLASKLFFKKSGFSLILVDQNLDKLQKLKSDLLRIDTGGDV